MALVMEEELTKHKALELELDTYSGLINEMGNMAMMSNNHLDSKVITQRQHLLSQGMKNPQKLASHRRQRLVDSGQSAHVPPRSREHPGQDQQTHDHGLFGGLRT
jgi:hypothetical protein